MAAAALVRHPPAPRAGGDNPPAGRVEGVIKATDLSGLVTISIGSAAGLTRGHTLEVYRSGSSPPESKYLGAVRVVETTPRQAVAQPVGRPAAPLRPGDRVASPTPGR